MVALVYAQEAEAEPMETAVVDEEISSEVEPELEELEQEELVITEDEIIDKEPAEENVLEGVAVEDNTLEKLGTVEQLQEKGGEETESEEEPTNEATINNDSYSESVTGNNQIDQADSGSKAVIDTGEAVSYANLVNLINSNLVNSNLKIFLLNNFSGDVADINLKDIWGEVLSGDSSGVEVAYNPTEYSNFIVISQKNEAEVNNNATVIANSGNNSVDENVGDVLIVSGNAIALANVINLVNTTLIGSNFLITVINVDGSTLGDIILPSPTMFQNGNNSQVGGLVFNENGALVNNSIQAQSNSGFNNILGGGESNLTSGDAVSSSNNNNWININGSSDLFLLTINTLGAWNGNIYNWSEPGSVETGGSVTTFSIGGGVGGSGPNFFAVVDLENNAVVNNNIVAQADSGNNNINNNSGSAGIITGNAIALVNLLNIVNTNFWGSNWFYGIINIVGNWNGNAIFAYPDLSIDVLQEKDSVEVGEEFFYTLVVKNEGYEDVFDATVEVNLDDSVEYLGDNSGIGSGIDGNKVRWNIGHIGARKGGSFQIKLRALKNKPTATVSGWKLVKTAWAAEDYEEIESIMRASVNTNQIESNLLNNSSSTQTKIIIYKLFDNSGNVGGDSGSEDGEKNHNKPEIKITAKNNVNGYVFPNDTVTFEIVIENVGDGDLSEAVLVHEIFDEKGNLWVADEVRIGKIKARKSGTVSFGIEMGVSIQKSTNYFSKSRVIGKTDEGDEMSSDNAITEFVVLFRGLAGNLLGPGVVSAAINEENLEGVLGDTSPAMNIRDRNYLYLLPGLLALLFLINRARRKLGQSG